jgi:hypothetical protein
MPPQPRASMTEFDEEDNHPAVGRPNCWSRSHILVDSLSLLPKGNLATYRADPNALIDRPEYAKVSEGHGTRVRSF